MSPRMNEKELLDRLAELPLEMRPNQDPWPEISARISRSGARTGSSHSIPGWMFRAAAASVVLVFAAGLLFKPSWNTDSQFSETPPPNSEAINIGAGEKAGTRAIPALLDTIDAEYLAAFREFINVGGSRSNLAPQTVDKIEKGWADLRVTESALAVALKKNPDDLFLNERMLELRARQLGFLKQLVSLDRNNRRLTI